MMTMPYRVIQSTHEMELNIPESYICNKDARNKYYTYTAMVYKK